MQAHGKLGERRTVYLQEVKDQRYGRVLIMGKPGITSQKTRGSQQESGALQGLLFRL